MPHDYDYHAASLAYGRRLGNALLRRQQKMTGFSKLTFLADAVASMLDTLSVAEPDRECMTLLHSWTWDTYWGIEVSRWLPRFETSYSRLKDLQASQRHPLVWGDIDYSAWIEPHPHWHILVVKDHATTRDDDTYLFFRQDHYRFHARTVWPRQQYWDYGRRNWPDDSAWRDIGRPSLGTYRQRKWQLGYGDCRDKGYAFSLDEFTGKVEGALAHYWKIIAALRVLESLEYGLAHPYQLPREA